MEYMKFIFYGLAAWITVIFFRAFLKSGKRNPNRLKRRDQIFSSYINISWVLSEGRILPNRSFPVLSQEQSLAGIEICSAKRVVLGRPKNLWHLKEKQTAVPSFSLTVTGEQLEVSIITEAEYGALLAQTIGQALQSTGGTVTLKCPLQLIVHALSVDHADQIEIEVGKFQFSNDVLKIEIPEIALFLTLKLDSSTKIALDHALDVVGRCA